MSDFQIELISPTGERKTVPLWKFPQMCADAVAGKKDCIAADKAAKEAKEKAEKLAEENRLAAIDVEAKHLDKPFDLAAAKEVK